jgi:hypothetical protein
VMAHGRPFGDGVKVQVAIFGGDKGLLIFWGGCLQRTAAADVAGHCQCGVELCPKMLLTTMTS